MLAAVREKTCPSCYTIFDCTNNCWCNDFPPIIPVNNKGCLCKTCLTNEVKNSINSYIQNLNPKRIKEVQKLGIPSKYIEGIDYTINKNGNWVFSSWYLLRQGKCCSNNCTNCPYPKKEVK